MRKSMRIYRWERPSVTVAVGWWRIVTQSVRVYRWSPGTLSVIVGPWQGKFCWPWAAGRFGNGSRWFSGWSHWDGQPEY